MKSHPRSSCRLLHSAKDIKHKISFLLQKPEHQPAESKQREKNAVAAAVAAAAQRSADALVWLKNTSGSLGCRINANKSFNVATLMNTTLLQ